MKLSTATTLHRPAFGRNRRLHALLIGFGSLWLAAGLAPRDRAEWAMENLLVVSLIAGLAGTYRVLPLSDLSYLCIAAFLALHTLGAHYTYPEVPLGEWARDWWGWERNHYDRLVHLAFGLFLAYPVREVVLRVLGVRGAWAYSLSAGAILALGAAYEIFEWGAATVLAPELGSAYLGTQGDEWDAQKDMLAGALGAVLAMAITAASRGGARGGLTASRGSAPARGGAGCRSSQSDGPA